ncbi:helix-turn-helix domain-containing protein [Formosa algae]|uniref:AraC-like DNA-binding protein n=1 Tax=Formosa algae TaxID=225843 RepID=A0A9X1CCQ8_9FLAO|nr:AraC family transcriptional regulator [Formosa algae]MBP1840530.1 AraC-like DNA-binding protein [Formosa algae]MDQ0336057.1 AraC-like DNA-binding protein [Formosa algae]OEI81059.1 hypothetical protein AST99_05190 [Formosa algae]
MKSVLKSHSFAQKTITRTFPKDFKTAKLNEETLITNGALVKGETKELVLDGIKISVRNGSITPPFVVDVEHDFPFLKIHFEIEGSSRYTPKNEKSVAVYIPNGHYNFFYLPEVKGQLEYDCTKRKTLEILFTKAYLERVFGHTFKNLSAEFGTALEQDIPFVMWEQSKPITAQLHLIIEEIVNCNYGECIKKAYLESKITEILAIFFDCLSHKQTQHDLCIPKEDHLKILHAESIISKNLKNPPSILELSHLTGINQFKLKQNFKLIFGKPIFTYVTELRMVKAKKLISEQGYTIAETAYEIGYKNPQHFTAAFKKKYNYLPSKLKTD